MDYYQFQVLVVGDGYGGLEHRASTSLMAKRDSLPKPGQPGSMTITAIFSACAATSIFTPGTSSASSPRFIRPMICRTRCIPTCCGRFEGITSYYDDLALLRCGLIDAPSYLELFAQTMTRVQRGQGRLRQSAAESSFNTWTKFYKQDENAANAIVSYYAKGCLIAACIDLKLRALTAGACQPR